MYLESDLEDSIVSESVRQSKVVNPENSYLDIRSTYDINAHWHVSGRRGYYFWYPSTKSFPSLTPSS